MKQIVCIGLSVVLATSAIAENVAPDDVVYGEYGDVTASLSGTAGDPAAGREIMIARGKGNCIACHAVTDLMDQPFHGEVGPMLDGAGDRWTAAELRGLVANAKMTFEGTVMPAFYKTSGFNRPGDAYTGKAAEGELSPLLTAQEIEDVVAYLQTLTE
ncbi:MAG: sulfur oxidation c-type cytochrome SoxX [Yoonia sp.]|uniref:sulfur oxidation c-type cytochrome SoxX n=1 Tax=Rhodobacterales TaxID=204455 RepID=UPI001FF28F1E|nr:sulfur oxidation c-type cytochrome SoxX [Loktanella sp. F6476L]MCK0119387.1 sulfur oxidation c-type cytochrome SoxX [Loktanella sp. F6476L]